MLGKITVILTGAAALSACSTLGTHTAQGIVSDASMNTLTITAEGNRRMTFATVGADRSQLRGLLIGDTVRVQYQGAYREGLDAQKVSTVSKVNDPWPVRFFNDSIRTEPADGTNRAIYVHMSDDELTADLYISAEKRTETLQRRTLPDGTHVWNIEDDDTKNLRMIDGRWTVSQRGKVIFKEPSGLADQSLGKLQYSDYQGVLPAADCPGIRYDLRIRNRANSGDGDFLLQMTYLEAENGLDKTYTYTGRRLTFRGSAFDNNSVVWQLISDGDGPRHNFLVSDGGQKLTLLTRNMDKIQSQLNYTLSKKE